MQLAAAVAASADGGGHGANPLRTSISAHYARRGADVGAGAPLSVDEAARMVDSSRVDDAAHRAYVLPVFPAQRSLAEERAALRRRESGAAAPVVGAPAADPAVRPRAPGPRNCRNGVRRPPVRSLCAGGRAARVRRGVKFKR